MLTTPGPGTFCNCGTRYELSGNFYRVIPKLVPLSFDSLRNDLISYFVAGGLIVRVRVKSDLFP